MTDRSDTAFPVLDSRTLDRLRSVGDRRPMIAGDYLYRSGDSGYDFNVVLSGLVDIIVDEGGAERLIIQHGAGGFLGELSLLTDHRVYVSARVSEDGEYIRVPAATLRTLLAADPHLGEIILTAFMARHDGLLVGAASWIRLLGSHHDPGTRELREFLVRNRVPHEWLDPDVDEQLNQLIERLGFPCRDLPVVLGPGTVLRRATLEATAAYLRLSISRLPERCFDLVVVGSGPAGLAAAVYGASEGLTTLAIDSLAAGGQAGTSSLIENYLGFPTGVSGAELTQRALAQAERFGARFVSPCVAERIHERSGHLVVRLVDGTDIGARAVIVATGARYRRLEVERLPEFEGNGVFYAATATEARACGVQPVIVVGGGNSAGQATMFLADHGNQVTVVIRKPDLADSMSRYLVDRIEAHSSVSVLANSTVTQLHGRSKLCAASIRSSGRTVTLPCGGVFSFIGAEPSTAWLADVAARDGHGFVLTDRSLGPSHLDERWHTLNREPLPYETNQPGLFAVGDARAGSIKRVAAAVGEGAAAIRSVHEYLAFAGHVHR